MSKPLLKDPSFWIVAITLVGAANIAQFHFGVPWLQTRAAALRPAPRMTNIVTQARGIALEPTNLDNTKKTYPWQKPRYQPRLLQESPPQVVLIPTEYTPPSGGWGTSSTNGAIGIRMTAQYVVQSAYSWRAQRRIIEADPLPPGQFDFIANLPSGSLEALQAEITKKWGLVAEHQIFHTNAVFLKLDHTNAPGLKVVAFRTPAVQNELGMQTVTASLADFFVPYLETILRKPVIDQTGLNGLVEVKWPINRTVGADAFDATRKMLLEQLGLDLIQTNAPVEMLVLKKAKEGNP